MIVGGMRLKVLMYDKNYSLYDTTTSTKFEITFSEEGKYDFMRNELHKINKMTKDEKRTMTNRNVEKKFKTFFPQLLFIQNKK